MNKILALGVAAAGAAIALRCVPKKSRSRLSAAVKKRAAEHMEQMMKNFPEGAPPRLVMSILPKLEEQNDRIVALLNEQNELLREQRSSALS